MEVGSDSLASADTYNALMEPGEHAVRTPVVCVITRFGFRRPSSLLPIIRDYRRVRSQAREAELPGLLQACLLLESPTVAHSLSIWETKEVIPQFGTAVPAHVYAARRALAKLRYSDEVGPELWSTKWRLVSVTNNLNWPGFDLRDVIRRYPRADDA